MICKNQGAVRASEKPVGDALFSFCIGQTGSELRGYIEKVRNSGRFVFIGELGFFDRGAHFGITKLNDQGVHNREEQWLTSVKKPKDRFSKFNIKVTTARDLPKKALLLGQVNGDTQLDGIDIIKWYDATREKAEAAGYEVTYRPHPRTAPPSKPLEDAVAESGLVMSYNSTGLLEAIVQGVPFYCSDKCQYAPLSSRIEKPKASTAKDRKQFLHNLAYLQYTAEEFADGTALAYIEERMNNG